MCEEYNSIWSTPTEPIGCFGQYRYIDETQISARLIYCSISSWVHYKSHYIWDFTMEMVIYLNMKLIY